MLDWSLTSPKTSVLPKGVTQQAALDAAQNIIDATHALTHLKLFSHLSVVKLSLVSVCLLALMLLYKI
jgi:hypothetical protein